MTHEHQRIIMKLARFRDNGGAIRLGRLEADAVIELPGTCAEVECFATLLRTQPDTLTRLLREPGWSGRRHELASVQLMAPVVWPSKFLAIGMNYSAHAQEAARLGVREVPSQVWFNKQVSSITGPGCDIELPACVEKLDYEGELGFVIGKRGRNIAAADALAYVAAYTIVNDVSARDWQAKSPTWTIGKSFDTHGPVGPWLVTADEVGDPQQLELRVRVNGELRQHASTAQMIHDIRSQIAFLSQVMTLEPGDLIATGTPAGVGVAMDPPRFMGHGDVVEVDIEQIGTLRNTVRPAGIAEGAAT